ncbi:hypothetical protein K488DRAFT_88473 [Vararia minispora EC-137]|uniref:Uncharacterized protein n=1 Tax=Vararia minispora EC-137 TaxID=1314806 RepID=A0ACB8QDM2_9AGAM|nr:hypothetical protein K488DRAFT_88473 [Vararia minispora EC-137]
MPQATRSARGGAQPLRRTVIRAEGSVVLNDDRRDSRQAPLNARRGVGPTRNPTRIPSVTNRQATTRAHTVQTTVRPTRSTHPAATQTGVTRPGPSAQAPQPSTARTQSARVTRSQTSAQAAAATSQTTQTTAARAPTTRALSTRSQTARSASTVTAPTPPTPILEQTPPDTIHTPLVDPIPSDPPATSTPPSVSEPPLRGPWTIRRIDTIPSTPASTTHSPAPRAAAFTKSPIVAEIDRSGSFLFGDAGAPIAVTPSYVVNDREPVLPPMFVDPNFQPSPLSQRYSRTPQAQASTSIVHMENADLNIANTDPFSSSSVPSSFSAGPASGAVSAQAVSSASKKPRDKGKAKAKDSGHKERGSSPPVSDLAPNLKRSFDEDTPKFAWSFDAVAHDILQTTTADDVLRQMGIADQQKHLDEFLKQAEMWQGEEWSDYRMRENWVPPDWHSSIGSHPR